MSKDTIEIGKNVLKAEAGAIQSLIDKLDQNFENAVQLLLKSKTHIIVSGVGKSGIIAQKIAATFSSTGSPSLYLHAGEAAHGDGGVISRGATCLLITHSGSTKELIKMVPLMKERDCSIIVITGNSKSQICKYADVTIDTQVTKEACPLDLAPTTSTTVSLALGDALAAGLIVRKGFTKKDFSLLHPGGRLGKTLLLKVADIMHSENEVPIAYLNDLVTTAIIEMSAKRMGFVIIMNDQKAVQGIITDGDLRRLVQNQADFNKLKCRDAMTSSPKFIEKGMLAASALKIMENNKITSLIVGKKHSLEGVVSIHDIISEGILK